MEPLVWSILLLLLGIGLIVLDIFLPSGAILSILGLVAMLAAVVVGYTGGVILGTVVLLVSTIVLPTIALLAVRFWPRTPFGRWILLQPKVAQVEEDPELQLEQLIGKRGRAKTKMLPSGAIVVEGRTYDAVSAGMPIDPGQPVEVIALRTHRIVVRPAAEADLPREQDPQELLSRPIDTLGGDPFEDDPLA